MRADPCPDGRTAPRVTKRHCLTTQTRKLINAPRRISVSCESRLRTFLEWEYLRIEVCEKCIACRCTDVSDSIWGTIWGSWDQDRRTVNCCRSVLVWEWRCIDRFDDDSTHDMRSAVMLMRNSSDQPRCLWKRHHETDWLYACSDRPSPHDFSGGMRRWRPRWCRDKRW